MRRRLGLAIFLLVAAGLAAFLWFGRKPASTTSPGAFEPETAFQSQIKNGDEVFAVEPEIVFGVDYETRERRVRAERPSPRDPFTINVSDSAGRELEHCQAGKAWDGVVPSFASVRALRVFSAAEARALWAAQGQGAATLRVRDTIAGEPTEFRALARREGDVVLRDSGGVFVSSLPLAVLRVLAAGCARVE